MESFKEAYAKKKIENDTYWNFIKMYEKRSGRVKDKDGNRMPRPPKEEQDKMFNEMRQMYRTHIY